MPAENPYQSPKIASADRPRRARRLWLFGALGLAVCGLGTLALGILYGAVMVGVPYQDPTPEMAAREAWHVWVSGWIMTVGTCLAIASLVAAVLAISLRAPGRESA